MIMRALLIVITKFAAVLIIMFFITCSFPPLFTCQPEPSGRVPRIAGFTIDGSRGIVFGGGLTLSEMRFLSGAFWVDHHQGDCDHSTCVTNCQERRRKYYINDGYHADVDDDDADADDDDDDDELIHSNEDDETNTNNVDRSSFTSDQFFTDQNYRESVLNEIAAGGNEVYNQRLAVIPTNDAQDQFKDCEICECVCLHTRNNNNNNNNDGSFTQLPNAGIYINNHGIMFDRDVSVDQIFSLTGDDWTYHHSSKCDRSTCVQNCQERDYRSSRDDDDARESEKEINTGDDSSNQGGSSSSSTDTVWPEFMSQFSKNSEFRTILLNQIASGVDLESQRLITNSNVQDFNNCKACECVCIQEELEGGSGRAQEYDNINVPADG